MNYMIKALTPELAVDFFDFFDNRAFTDNSPMQPCYCCTLNMTDEQIKLDVLGQVESNGGGIEGIRQTLRKIAEKAIMEGELKGYLAFDDGIAIGWCNANDKTYYRQIPTFAVENNIGRTKSIMCFEVSPEYRGKGVATALLEQVILDAKEDGYIALEGYPQVQEKRETFDFVGPVRLYEKLGFTREAQQDNVILMRKVLG
jgi:GNAT superfamily N-acetyltransferase